MILDFTIGVLLAFVLSGLAYYKKWLNRSGALAATLLGGIVWGIGLWKTSLPLIFFFVTSSLLSLGRKKLAAVDEKDSRPRDAVQVFCNAGVAFVCLMAYAVSRDWLFMIAYWASLAVSMADTWSSGVGNRYARSVFDITTFRKMAKGLSGGISTIGTIAGLLAALMLALIGWLIYTSDFPLALVMLVGFSGMLLDSILGSVWQVKYRLSNGEQLESARLVKGHFTRKGIKWMNNDMVNFLSNLIVILLLLTYLKLR